MESGNGKVNVRASPRELYLDLLIKTLTNLIYGDSSIHPSNTGPFQPELRSEGRDWPAVAHTMVGVRRLENLRELAQRVIDEAIPGDFIETGVWRGGCCILLRGVLAANAITDRRVYVADSFAGLPPPKPLAFPQDEGLNLHLQPELAVPLEQVKDNFDRYGLLDDRVVFLKGLFQDTLTSLDVGPLALLRLDGDLYESTYVALKALYPSVSPGGFVIIDDYAMPSCRAAVSDYLSLMGIEVPMHEIDWTGVWWRKPRSRSEANQAIHSRDEALARLETRLAGLQQTVQEQDSRIVSLSEALADRQGETASLSEALTTRVGEIELLNQALTTRAGEIELLNQAVADLDAQPPLQYAKKMTRRGIAKLGSFLKPGSRTR